MGASIKTMESGTRPFFVALALLACIYCAWQLAIWPGILGQDSYAVLLQIGGDGSFQSGKPIFWYLFVKALYGSWRLVEVPVIAMLAVSALVYSRILAWCWVQKMRAVAVLIFVFVCAAPHVIFFQSTLYADGIFAAAATGLAFECWQIVRTRSLGWLQLAWLAVLTPMALYFRANGIFLLLLFVPAIWSLQRRDQLKLAALLVFWLAAHAVAQRMNPLTKEHGALYPLALFETVNFMRPQAMNFRPMEEKISEPTLALLRTKAPLEKIVAFYDKDYWDPLVYLQQGPTLGDIPADEKEQIIKQFFSRNLWKNLPAFAASRVNIFLVSLLARGDFISPDDTLWIAPAGKAQSRLRPFPNTLFEPQLRAVYQWSYKHRWLLWSPLPGIALMLVLMRRFWRRRDWRQFMLVAPFGLQLGGIFMMSIAGEYRYLLAFYTGMVVWMPMVLMTRREGVGA